MVDIKSQTLEGVREAFKSWGEPGYRLDQLFRWLYQERVTSWDAMTNLPKALREKLKAHFNLTTLVLVRKQGSRDTTQKFLWRLVDQSLIESVLIPANPALYGEASDRHTLCVSTQVGCAYGCRFCASGLEGWKRNLGPEELVEQILATERWNEADRKSETERRSEVGDRRSEVGGQKSEDGDRKPEVGDRKPEVGGQKSEVPGPILQEKAERLISNLVIMGMGEPLANYANLMQALKILNAPWGGGIGARKITISTSGLAPQIRQLADEALQFRLAISLHGATDEIRNRIMPVNRKYQLRDLEAACAYYQEKKGRMITFEYILIAGVNDRPEQARPLAAMAKRLHAKVNLIPYNTVEGLPWERPSEASQDRFLAALQKEGISVTLRREKGHDIDAACGQLRLKTERELATSAS